MKHEIVKAIMKMAILTYYYHKDYIGASDNKNRNRSRWLNNY